MYNRRGLGVHKLNSKVYFFISKQCMYVTLWYYRTRPHAIPTHRFCSSCFNLFTIKVQSTYCVDNAKGPKSGILLTGKTLKECLNSRIAINHQALYNPPLSPLRRLRSDLKFSITRERQMCTLPKSANMVHCLVLFQLGVFSAVFSL